MYITTFITNIICSTFICPVKVHKTHSYSIHKCLSSPELSALTDHTFKFKTSFYIMFFYFFYFTHDFVFKLFLWEGCVRLEGARRLRAGKVGRMEGKVICFKTSFNHPYFHSSFLLFFLFKF